MKNIGLIFSAGAESRFSDLAPKALSQISADTTILDINIKNMSTVCDNVYVVCSVYNQDWFVNYPKIVIHRSGFGCGDAVLQALEALDYSEEDNVFIQWGDSWSDQEIYKITVEEWEQRGGVVIPGRVEKQPYVQLTHADNIVTGAIFSKYHETTTEGVHDLSMFFGSASLIHKSLKLLAEKHWLHSDKIYIHAHGDELNFLDIFNETWITGNLVIIQNHNSYSFNTIEEFQEAKKQYLLVE